MTATSHGGGQFPGRLRSPLGLVNPQVNPCLCYSWLVLNINESPLLNLPPAIINFAGSLYVSYYRHYRCLSITLDHGPWSLGPEP